MKKRLLALLLIGTLFAQSGIALAAEISVDDSGETEEVAEEIVVTDGEDTEEVIEPVEVEETADDTEETVAEESVQAIAVEDSAVSISSTASGKCGDNLTWSYSNGVLKIDGTGPMYAFCHWDDQTECYVGEHPPWEAHYGDQITSVEFGSGVTTVGTGAFRTCPNIKEVTVPANVKEIGTYAFRTEGSFHGEPHLEKITILNRNCKIGDEWNTAIEPGAMIIGYVGSTAQEYAMRFPADYLFCDIETGKFVWQSGSGEYEGISWVLQDGTLTLSGTGAIPERWADCFPYRNQIQNVVIQEGITSIEPLCWWRCESVESVTCPDSMKKIGNEAFAYCRNLKSISMPKVTEISDGAFNYCEKLQSVSMPSVVNIGKYAFAHCSQLKSVSLPDCLTKIEDGAFAYAALQSIELPESISEITPSLFEGTDLKSFTIPSHIKSVGNGAFVSCSKLTEVSIPQGIAKIEKYTFEDCTSLKTINIPNSVTSIGEAAFENCKSLTRITIPSTVKSIGEEAFWKCGKLTQINIPQGIKKIDSLTFGQCSALKNIQIPDSVTSIEFAAFCECSSLDNIVIPASVTKIGQAAFSDCTSLRNITIPSSVTSVGLGVFDGCSNLDQSIVQTISGKITDDGTADVISTASISVSASKYYYTFPKNTILYGYANSTIQKYAKKHGRTFRAFHTPYLSKSTFTYNGKVQKPSIVIYGKNGKPVSSSACKVTWPSGCKNVGKYTVKLTYKGKTTSQSFTINPKSTALASLASGSQSFTAKWTKQPTQTSGYQLRYATNSKFTGAKTVTITSNKTTSKKITGLKDATKYYVQIRTYKTVSGKKYYSNWSSAKTVTTKAPVPKATSLTSVTAASKGFTAKWSKQTTQTTGYQLQYSTSSKFTGAKTVWITSNKTTSKKLSGLTAKKKYYVRIRTYKTANGKKYYSSWSKTKTVTTKK